MPGHLQARKDPTERENKCVLQTSCTGETVELVDNTDSSGKACTVCTACKDKEDPRSARSPSVESRTVSPTPTSAM